MQEFQKQNPQIDDLISEKGDVYKTKYLTQAMPELGRFADNWSAELGREVNIVGKPYSGSSGAPRSTWLVSGGS
jgi:hypothetical protein